MTSLLKASFAFLCLFLLSNGLMAQTALVTNDTGCDMEVTIYGTDDCGSVECTQTQIVAAYSTQNISLPCKSNVVYAEVTADCTTSPILELETPGCHCGGATTDNDTFTIGMWTVTATSTCSGSSVTIDITD